MRQLGWLLSATMWLLVAGSVVVLTGGLFGRPLLLAAVPTGSMLPVLAPGDMIIVIPTWAMAPVDIGDIVVFKTPQDKQWVVHRVVGGGALEGFVTRGDANPTADAPRVFPKDIAGLVPQSGEQAYRLPRLGLLSLAEGPVSSPVVAGVALVMGVYLLVMDARPRVRLPRLRLRAKGSPRPSTVLSFYFGLTTTAFLTTLIPAWTLSSSQLIRYEVVEQVNLRHTVEGRYVVGQLHREPVVITNPAPIPMVVLFASTDPNLTYEPGWALVPPRGEITFQVTVQTPELGQFHSKVNMGVFAPLMPPVLLAQLGRINMALAALATALVPALLLLAVALLDIRCRMALLRMRAVLVARLGI